MGGARVVKVETWERGFKLIASQKIARHEPKTREGRHLPTVPPATSTHTAGGITRNFADKDGAGKGHRTRSKF